MHRGNRRHTPTYRVRTKRKAPLATSASTLSRRRRSSSLRGVGSRRRAPARQRALYTTPRERWHTTAARMAHSVILAPIPRGWRAYIPIVGLTPSQSCRPPPNALFTTTTIHSRAGSRKGQFFFDQDPTFETNPNPELETVVVLVPVLLFRAFLSSPSL